MRVTTWDMEDHRVLAKAKCSEGTYVVLRLDTGFLALAHVVEQGRRAEKLSIMPLIKPNAPESEPRVAKRMLTDVGFDPEDVVMVSPAA